MHQQNLSSLDIEINIQEDDRRILQIQKLIFKQNCYVQQYKIIRILGQGQFGKVFQAKNRYSNKCVAIKIYDLTYLKLKYGYIDGMLDYIKEEIKVLHLVRCYEHFRNKYAIILILEYCGSMNLYNILQQRGSLKQSQAVYLLKQICLGLIELHKRYIIHRDLKLENIMVQNGICKIVDLGICKRLGSQSEVTFTKAGTDYIQAPQVKKGEYGLKADIYSLGILYLIMIGTGDIHQRTAFKFLNSKPNDPGYIFKNKAISNNSINFITRTIARKPQNRLSWQQLLNEPIFQDYSNFSESMINDIDDNFNKIKQSVCKIVLDSQIDVNSQFDPISQTFIVRSNHSSIHSTIFLQDQDSQSISVSEDAIIYKSKDVQYPNRVFQKHYDKRIGQQQSSFQYASRLKQASKAHPKSITQISQLIPLISSSELLTLEGILTNNAQILQHIISLKKAQYLINNNIQQFERHSNLSLSIEKVLIILYLISLRAFLYINSSFTYFQQHKITIILKQYKHLQQKITSKYNYYQQKIGQSQKSLQFNIKKSIFKIFNSKQFQINKNIIDNSDIINTENQQQQINIIYKYILDIVNLINNTKLKIYMLAFKDITNISCRNMKEDSFNGEVAKILKQYALLY